MGHVGYLPQVTARLDRQNPQPGGHLGSSFTWLDYSERDRKRSLDAIDSIAEHDTRDELGLGVIRDAFSELFFPGTTTLQTRARYFLIVPWMYLSLEGRRMPSVRVDKERVWFENNLVGALLSSGESDGVIGKVAGARLQRKPSSIYWYGLGRWGIRRLNATQGRYQQSLDGYYRRRRQSRNAGDEVAEQTAPNWHAGLPELPAGWPDQASLTLRPIEGDYLAERLAVHAGDALLAYLATHGKPWQSTDFAWTHPQLAQFPSEARFQLEHARLFSTVMHGAALLYNLMLAELRRNDEWVTYYQGRLDAWAQSIEHTRDSLSSWDTPAFWRLVINAGARVSAPTQRFVSEWIRLVQRDDAAERIADDDRARRHIGDRECRLKGSQARLTNPRSLELWGGGSGTAALDFRWGVTQRMLLDIVSARDEAKGA